VDPALQDSRTPAFAVALAVAVNIMSNLVAVAWLGLGLQGAAATTVATQVSTTCYCHLAYKSAVFVCDCDWFCYVHGC